MARNLLRGHGYTESFVPFHPAVYESVRHMPELHGLLRPFLLVPLFQLLGVGPLALRIPGLLYTALTGLVVFLWGLRVFGREAALLACLLTLMNVNLLSFSLLGADDVGFAFFFTSVLALLHLALTTERDRYFLMAGLVSGLALLEKPSGFLIAAVFLVTAFALPRRRPPQVARWLALLCGPFLAAASVYLIRNYVAYGSFQFRFGVLNWIGRVEGHEGWARVFERTPSLLGFLQTIGWHRVIGMVGAEVSRFLRTILRLRPLAAGNPLSTLMAPAFLPALALCGIPLYARRMPAMTGLFVGSLVASVGFICLLYTALVRYFSMLIPLFALWAGGVLAYGPRLGVAGWPGWLLRMSSVLLGGGILALSGAGFISAQRALGGLPELNVCPRAVGWLAARTRPDERIMTFDPWFVAWAADREAIMIPSGGVEAIVGVARRYGARWMLAHAARNRPLTSEVVMGIEGRAGDLRTTRRFDDGLCRVYQLDWPEEQGGGLRPPS
ncbi:MAG TPA: glycosyltransferase family 39 protein [Candidatus Limnocylindria bacterium]|nr:glycosyltransferase family 39 protein [Candidatus Limnocylindria bacterium]